MDVNGTLQTTKQPEERQEIKMQNITCFIYIKHTKHI